MTETMRAARYPTGGPERGRLSVAEIDRPAPGPGEVLVRVRVSGVNPTDWKARHRGDETFPWVVPNEDGAGEIEAAGEGVDPTRIGQRVWLYNARWGRRQGTAAQWIALPAEQAVPLPENASFDLGAGLGIPAFTAHACLFSNGELDGASVLVQGGAGAVGHAAIELAREAGARVAATVSSEEKARLAVAAGAGLVVNYRSEDVDAVVRGWAPNGVDRIVEVDLDRNLETDVAVVAPGGVISSYVRAERPASLPWTLWQRNVVLRFVLVYTIPDAAKRRAVADITRALEAGALTPLPGIRFPLSEVAGAHDAVEGNAVGKVLIDIP
jgi:NADPH:quinone reductase